MVSQNQRRQVISQGTVDKYAFTFNELWAKVKAHGESCDDWDERFSYAICAFIFEKCCVPVIDLTAPCIQLTRRLDASRREFSRAPSTSRLDLVSRR